MMKHISNFMRRWDKIRKQIKADQSDASDMFIPTGLPYPQREQDRIDAGVDEPLLTNKE